MNHLIHRVRVDLRAHTRAAATAAQDAASRALQHDLGAVEAVFDARFPENTTHRLDRFEVDLGTLPLRGFRQALMASLVKSLIRLDTKVAPTPSAVRISEPSQVTGRDAQAAADSEDAVEVFLYYVVHGSLPWFFPLERWRDEIPRVLMAGEAFSALRTRLPSLVLNDPARLLRLLPFPSLVTALFASAFQAANETAAGVSSAWLAARLGAGLRLALWFLRVNPEPDATAETTLLHLLADDVGGALPIELAEIQPLLPALAAFGEIAKWPETAHLARLIKRPRGRIADYRATERIEFAKSETPGLREDFAESGVSTDSAGLVLLYPFLIRFFQLFGWLDDRLRILDERRWHAAHAMHWIAHKHLARDDVDLVLEKALCGIPLGEAARWPELEYRVTEEAESLLRAVIGHWKALKDTSPDGLREAFLVRPGLYYPEKAPHLHVETRAYDMLLSRLPWSFDRVTLPWLRSPIQVRWPKPT